MLVLLLNMFNLGVVLVPDKFFLIRACLFKRLTFLLSFFLQLLS